MLAKLYASKYLRANSSGFWQNIRPNERNTHMPHQFFLGVTLDRSKKMSCLDFLTNAFQSTENRMKVSPILVTL